MKWNHRVVRVKDGDEYMLLLAEVYYNDDGTPSGYSECFMHSETKAGLVELTDRLAQAVERPIINAEDMKRKDTDDDETSCVG